MIQWRLGPGQSNYSDGLLMVNMAKGFPSPDVAGYTEDWSESTMIHLSMYKLFYVYAVNLPFNQFCVHICSTDLKS